MTSTSPRHALVVDESQAIKKVSRRILELYGFQVSDADNPEHGIGLWNQWKPDLVLANWYAAGAHWFFQNIRKNPNRLTTKLVAFIVEIDPKEMENAVRVGVDAFLLKPFTRETVETMLDEVGLLPSEIIERPQLVSDDSSLPVTSTPDHTVFGGRRLPHGSNRQARNSTSDHHLLPPDTTRSLRAGTSGRGRGGSRSTKRAGTVPGTDGADSAKDNPPLGTSADRAAGFRDRTSRQDGSIDRTLAAYIRRSQHGRSRKETWQGCPTCGEIIERNEN